ncbi:unnamed protein product [Closterium sp. NIES-53]
MSGASRDRNCLKLHLCFVSTFHDLPCFLSPTSICPPSVGHAPLPVWVAGIEQQRWALVGSNVVAVLPAMVSLYLGVRKRG